MQLGDIKCLRIFDWQNMRCAVECKSNEERLPIIKRIKERGSVYAK